MFSAYVYKDVMDLWRTMWNNNIKYEISELERTINHIKWLKDRSPTTVLVKEQVTVYAVYREIRKDIYLCIAFTEYKLRYITLDASTAVTSALSSAGFISLLDYKFNKTP